MSNNEPEILTSQLNQSCLEGTDRRRRSDGDPVFNLGDACRPPRDALGLLSFRPGTSRAASITSPPEAVTEMRSALISALRLSAFSILALISEGAKRGVNFTRFNMPLTPLSLRTTTSARLRSDSHSVLPSRVIEPFLTTTLMFSVTIEEAHLDRFDRSTGDLRIGPFHE